MHQMNIVFCLDHNFVMPCGVLLQSICVNNCNVHLAFYAITDDSLTDIDRRDLQNIINRRGSKNSIQFVSLKDEQISLFLQFETSRYPRQTFYRLLIGTILPQNVEKVLYLDGDIIVRGSLDDIWNIDLTGISVCAAPDALSGVLEYYNRLEYPMSKGYFNAGVLLINLKYWRENNLEGKCLNFIKEHFDRIRLNDQDILNFITYNTKLHLPIKYNLQTQFLYKNKYQCFSIYQYKDEYDEARVNPIIIHYAGCRPWEYGCQHPYKDEWFKYREQTIWKDIPLQKSHIGAKIRLKNFIRKILTPIGITHYVADYFDRTLILASR